MNVSIDIQGLAETKEVLLEEVPDLVRKLTFSIETGAKVLIQTSPSSGKIYPRGSGFHQASAPGEPPATDTGNLVNRIQANLESDLLGTIESGAEYSSILEDRDRPFMSTAVVDAINNFF